MGIARVLAMRQLLPRPIDAPELGVLDDREDRPAPHDRPWVMANMVMSVDGAYAVDGRSGELGTTGDKRLFHRLRGASDVVLVAAGTARAERYRRPHSDTELRDRRRSQRLADDPRLVLVSSSLDLPGDLPLLDGPGSEPWVLHPEHSDTTGVPAGVRLRTAGADTVDLRAALRLLREEGVELVMCEGGPSLLGQLHALDVLDELACTTSPWMVGGDAVGLLGSTAATPRPVLLHRLWEEDGALFATYRRDRRN